MSAVEFEHELARVTEIRTPELVPELRLTLAPGGQSFEQFRARAARVIGAAPPYWAIAWPGGQALARYLLDHPAIVGGRAVLDLGGGSGLAAIAAARAGAARVTGIDCDPIAVAVQARNARLDGAPVDCRRGDLAAGDQPVADVVLAGDLWYEPRLARLATSVLRRLAGAGAIVLAGDPGRPTFPRTGRALVASYAVSADEQFERAATITASVWRVLPAGRA